MGMYLNSGNENFKMDLNSQIYVDKTEMVMHVNSVVNTNKRYMCISRPRRFGKTMAASMLCAYFGMGDSRELFERTKLSSHEGWDRYLNGFDEYSILYPMQLAAYTGFTDDEVNDLCRSYGRNYEKIKEWYDGYDVSDIIPVYPDYAYYNLSGNELKPKHYSIYSPLSVVNAMSTGYIQN